MSIMLAIAALQGGLAGADDAALTRRYGQPSDIRSGEERTLTWSDLEPDKAESLHRDGIRRIVVIRNAAGRRVHIMRTIK